MGAQGQGSHVRLDLAVQIQHFGALLEGVINPATGSYTDNDLRTSLAHLGDDVPEDLRPVGGFTLLIPGVDM